MRVIFMLHTHAVKMRSIQDYYAGTIAALHSPRAAGQQNLSKVNGTRLHIAKLESETRLGGRDFDGLGEANVADSGPEADMFQDRLKATIKIAVGIDYEPPRIKGRLHPLFCMPPE
jgi:hypothetical protein